MRDFYQYKNNMTTLQIFMQLIHKNRFVRGNMSAYSSMQ